MRQGYQQVDTKGDKTISKGDMNAIVCNANVGDTSEIIQKTGTGVVVQSFSEMDYDFIIEQIPQLLSIPSQKIRNAAIEHFSLDVGGLSYEQVYKLAQ